MANSEHDSVFRKYPDEHFDTVKYYVMFVGHARSGTASSAPFLTLTEHGGGQ